MPKFMNKSPSKEALETAESDAKKTMTALDTYYLKESKFICGGEISIADLQAICEVAQFWIAGESFESEYPNIVRWIEDCKAELGQHFADVHPEEMFQKGKNFFDSI